MNKSFLLNICLVVSLPLLLSYPLHANDVVKVAAPPSIFIKQQQGELRGPLIDLLETILQEKGVTMKTEAVPWKRATALLKDGEIDIIPVIFKTEERARIFEYSIPYIKVPTSVFTPKNKAFHFSNVLDLKGKKGVMHKGDSISPEFDALKAELDITEIASYEQMVKMLSSQRVDYAVAARYGFEQEAVRLQSRDQIDKLSTDIASRSLHIAISKKSKAVKYLDDINRYLSNAIDSGVIDNITHSLVNNEQYSMTK